MFEKFPSSKWGGGIYCLSLSSPGKILTEMTLRNVLREAENDRGRKGKMGEKGVRKGERRS